MAIRLCSYNIEWFTRLFNDDNTLSDKPKDVDRLDAIAEVIKNLNADLIGIVEAPHTVKDGSHTTVRKLENFATQYNLRTSKALTGFISVGTQEIAVLYDPAILTVLHEPAGTSNPEDNPRFDRVFHFDADNDRIFEVYNHHRPPLEAKVKINTSNKEFRLLVAHVKSKGVFDNVDMIHLEREARRNRLKIYAECRWIRNHVDEWLDNGHNVVVMGDINDGPGMDEYEMRYGKSGVEVIMGSLFEPDKILRNPAGMPKWGDFGWEPSTAQFTDRFTGDPINVMIDHILISNSFKTSGGTPLQIWNPYQNEQMKPLQADLVKASDHFPVTIDLEL